jgi:hypothetical protein
MVGLIRGGRACLGHSLITKISVNTIGRSDSIDDLMLSHMDFENDSLTVDAIDTFISRQLFDYSYPLLL